MNRKNDCGTPTHQTRQQWTAKDVEKNRVSFKITTQNNKNVIFIGFDGLFDLRIRNEFFVQKIIKKNETVTGINKEEKKQLYENRFQQK